MHNEISTATPASNANSAAVIESAPEGHREDSEGDYRVDHLGSVRGTPQGGMRAPAYLTRTGVFTYRNPDGTPRRELRHPEDVFAADSLATLAGAPVTVGHPGKVTPANWRKYAVGHVGDLVKAEGAFAAGDILVQDGATLKGVGDKSLVEISCGYSMKLDNTPGEYEGEKYDARQTNIRYNHVALGPSGWGRAGGDVRLRLDGTYAVGMPTEQEIADAREDAKTAREETGAAREDAKREKARADTLQGRLDAAESRAKALEAASTPEALDARVTARVALQDAARKLLGADFRADGKSDRDVMVAALVKGDANFRADGLSDDYVRGRFEAAAAHAPVAALGAVQGRADASNGAAGKSSINAARDRMLARNSGVTPPGSK